MRNTGRVSSGSRRRQNAMNTSAFMVPVKVENHSFPFGVIAEIMLTEYRAPVEVTTGVCPIGAQGRYGRQSVTGQRVDHIESGHIDDHFATDGPQSSRAG